MVSTFPLNNMHLVLLGVIRRLLIIWTVGNNRYRLDPRSKYEISKYLVSVCDKITVDFGRKPRKSTECRRWKATELRQFLLYTGNIVLKNNFI